MKKQAIIAVPVALFVAVAVQAQIPGYLFSTDIGSDLDQSDPNTPGFMDAGAIYRPGTPGNPQLWKNDDGPTPQWPGYPFANAPQPLPGQIGTQFNTDLYETYFDLDAEDQVADWAAVEPGHRTSLENLESMGIYSIRRETHMSYDDDGPNGWAVSGDVPTTASPDRATEIFGTTLTVPPPGVNTASARVDELGLTLDPNPGGMLLDDDVDALDWHPLFDNPMDPGAFQARFFSPDHEANLGLDDGDIYLTFRQPGGQNVTPAYDDVVHFGVLDETDIDAFEFVAIDDEWADLLGIVLNSNEWTVGALFSVDEDDGDTPLRNESGGLNPNVIYLTDLQGNFVAASGDFGSDIDALTVIPEPSVIALVGIFGGGMWLFRRIFSI